MSKRIKSIFDTDYFWQLKVEKDFPHSEKLFTTYKELYITQFLNVAYGPDWDELDNNLIQFKDRDGTLRIVDLTELKQAHKNHDIMTFEIWKDYYIISACSCPYGFGIWAINKINKKIDLLYYTEDFATIIFNLNYMVIMHPSYERICYFDINLEEHCIDTTQLKLIDPQKNDTLKDEVNKKIKLLYEIEKKYLRKSSYQPIETSSSKFLINEHLKYTDSQLSTDNCIYTNLLKIDFINQIVYWK